MLQPYPLSPYPLFPYAADFRMRSNHRYRSSVATARAR